MAQGEADYRENGGSQAILHDTQSILVYEKKFNQSAISIVLCLVLLETLCGNYDRVIDSPERCRAPEEVLQRNI